MKVCVITYDEYINIPYIQNYEAIMQRKGIDYDVILWNRTGAGTDIPEHARKSYLFSYNTHASKFSKIVPFLKWRRFAKKIILNSGGYDALIVCTTMSGILLSDILLKNFRNRYILDVRDYTYESWPIYRIVSNNNLKSAGLAVISSDGFREWLPQGIEYTVTHNIFNENNAVKEPPDFDKPLLTIGFAGGVRYHKTNAKLIDQLANNQRYKLLYAGKHHPGLDLIAYCNEYNIKNVEFMPRFNNSQKPEIYSRFDLINSIYGADSEETRTLLPHKIYDCILFKKPIIVSAGTYLEKIVDQYQLGFAVDIDNDDIPRRLDKYLRNFNAEEFKAGCQALLTKTLSEEAIFKARVEEFFERTITAV